MRPLVRVNGVALPEPTKYNATTSTAVDSARNAKGEMVGAVIRDSLAKIECTWNYISAENWAKVLQMFNVSLGGSFTNPVEFYNQDINGWETRTMYVSDKTASIFLRDDAGNIRGFENARIALIEV